LLKWPFIQKKVSVSTFVQAQRSHGSCKVHLSLGWLNPKIFFDEHLQKNFIGSFLMKRKSPLTSTIEIFFKIFAKYDISVKRAIFGHFSSFLGSSVFINLIKSVLKTFTKLYWCIYCHMGPKEVKNRVFSFQNQPFQKMVDFRG